MTDSVTVGVYLDLAIRLSIVAAGMTMKPGEVDALFQNIQSGVLDQFKDNDRVTALEVYQDIWNKVIEVSKAANK